MNCLQILQETGMRLEGLSETPELDAQVLLAHCIGRDRQFLFAHPEYEPTGVEVDRFRSMVARRMRAEPIAYITGVKEFWSLTFAVTPDVLIPRPDTEILVEAVVRLCREEGIPDARILEIGTGSGAISVALASELHRAIIKATDFSQKALAVAAGNARRNGVHQNISFVCADLFDQVEGVYDIVVSNPPYISEGEYGYLSAEVREHEPCQALVAGPGGTEMHRNIIEGAPPFMSDGGWLVLEMGAGQRDAVEKMLHENSYCDMVFHRDYAGIERVVLARKRE
ncbi:MAG: peptide chain release factor N(5)-glutamine methyltransferase [Deltaproteobacteria bacterium]|nr:peptide chain release factor N(5)-glutamine methyltransferase [Deltaproteobacteria bacterium]